jgi:hypothetical protein
MPKTEVIYYCEANDVVPVLDWLTEVGRKDRRAVEKCIARIELLREHGHELRRPTADYLRDGIYELRAQVGRMQYRILYFFHGRNAVVLANGLTKEGKVPASEIERALARKRLFEKAPARHSYGKDSTNG